MIRQRQAEGIAAAKDRGVKFGRPPKERPTIAPPLKTLNNMLCDWVWTLSQRTGWIITVLQIWVNPYWAKKSVSGKRIACSSVVSMGFICDMQWLKADRNPETQKYNATSYWEGKPYSTDKTYDPQWECVIDLPIRIIREIADWLFIKIMYRGCSKTVRRKRIKKQNGRDKNSRFHSAFLV